MKKEGFVYLIRGPKNGSEQLYKIGQTSNMQNRMRNLQTGSPTKLEVVKFIQTEDALMTERKLHDAFSETRIQGEWFALKKGQVRAVKKLMHKNRKRRRGRLLSFILILSILTLTLVFATDWIPK
tara:strand:+ start:116 stop:490 length:375 start_codon:yes stop_codon:yes gene_type:complete